MKSLVPIALVMTFATFSTGACSNDSSTPATTAPSPTMTETFNGTVGVAAGNFHNFTVAQDGTVSVTLTAATPPPTIFMGVGIGTPSSSTCALISGDTTATPAGPTAQLSGTLNAGTYCVEVFDVGNDTAPVTYSVTVVHS
jgi:hypothetical protein